MDLAALKVVSAAEVGSELVLLNPFTGDETDLVLTVLGYDAATVQDAEDRAKKEFMSKPKGGLDEMQGKTRLARVCAAIVDWRGLSSDGKELAYSKENVREIISDPEFAWIADQVEAFAMRRANFMPSELKG